MMINGYSFGTMTIDERKHRKDLKIIEGKVIEAWWRKEGHSVDLEDVEDILAAAPEVLVVGMGDPGRMQATESLRSALAGARIDLIEEPTALAVQTFNRLLQKGKKVAGAFHLTC